MNSDSYQYSAGRIFTQKHGDRVLMNREYDSLKIIGIDDFTEKWNCDWKFSD